MVYVHIDRVELLIAVQVKCTQDAGQSNVKPTDRVEDLLYKSEGGEEIN